MSEELEFIAGDCQQGTCPTIYRTHRGTYGFQGPAMTDHGLDLPMGEVISELPAAVVHQLLERLARDLD